MAKDVSSTVTGRASNTLTGQDRYPYGPKVVPYGPRQQYFESRVVPLRAKGSTLTGRLRARAGSNHYSLVRPTNNNNIWPYIVSESTLKDLFFLQSYFFHCSFCLSAFFSFLCHFFKLIRARGQCYLTKFRFIHICILFNTEFGSNLVIFSTTLIRTL